MNTPFPFQTIPILTALIEAIDHVYWDGPEDLYDEEYIRDLRTRARQLLHDLQVWKEECAGADDLDRSDVLVP